MISILFMTKDRPEETRRTLEQNLRNTGVDEPVELLWCDNGSTETSVHDIVKSFNPSYSRLNKENEGVARGFNQLYLRAKGDWIVLMGNDVLMPKGWLNEMLKYGKFVPKPGLIGIKCTAQIPVLSYKFACFAHFLDDKCDKVFGVTMFHRAVVEHLGLFCERFHPYGLEDSDFNNRVNRAGYNSLYVPDSHFQSTHIGNDVGHANKYRKMKDESLTHGLSVLGERIAMYPTNLVEPLPPMREPL